MLHAEVMEKKFLGSGVCELTWHNTTPCYVLYTWRYLGRCLLPSLLKVKPCSEVALLDLKQWDWSQPGLMEHMRSISSEGLRGSSVVEKQEWIKKCMIEKATACQVSDALTQTACSCMFVVVSVLVPLTLCAPLGCSSLCYSEQTEAPGC